MKTFAAQLKDIEKLTKKRLRYVAVNAIQDVMEAAQTPQPSSKRTGTFQDGKIPVDTGDLINSLTSNGVKGAGSYAVALAGYDIGDYMRFSWTAPHARRIEQGFTGVDSLGRKYNQAGRHFVVANAERFSEFVARRAREVRS